MHPDPERLRFIPFRKRDIVDLMANLPALPDGDRKPFREFCHVLQSVYHFDFHQTLETLKDLYAPYNPDRDTRIIDQLVPTDVASPKAKFTESLDQLLNAVNYEKMDQAALEAAFDESSLFKLRLKIDFDAFDDVMFYTRGEREKSDEVSALFGLVKKQVKFLNFDRVVLAIRYKPESPEAVQGATLLKLFQNVPRADVEMLFPNTRIGMRLLDKMLIGVTAVIGAVAIGMTKAVASLLLLATLIGFWLGLHSEQVELGQVQMVAILAGLAGLGSYIWKQFSNFKNRKLLFMQSLTQNLYFKNLDNNAGVFHRLVDDAEEKECKEAILAYCFLLTTGPAPNAQTLDTAIETWFRDTQQCELNFEVSDALRKLKELGLLDEKNEQISVVSRRAVLEILDGRWDQYFTDHQA